VLILLAFTGVLALIVPPVIDGASQLSSDIPGYIEDLRNNGTIRNFDNKYEITGTLQKEAGKLPSRLGDAAGALQSVASTTFNTAFQLLTVLTMTFFLLLDGRRIATFLVDRFGHERAPQLGVVVQRIYKSTAGYVAGALTISSINGLITFITLTILKVSFAVPLAVLMFFFGLIPLVGATIGGVIILAVTLFTNFPTATIVYAIVLILYQQLENNVLQPFVYKRTVNVPPLAVIVAILAGSSILGVLGALVAIPIAAALQIVIREFYGLREPPADPPLSETPPGEPPPSGGSPPGKRPPAGGSPPGERPPAGGSPPGKRLPSGGSPPGKRPPRKPSPRTPPRSPGRSTRTKPAPP
jgi:predicted PurR-regulated permease PerM